MLDKTYSAAQIEAKHYADWEQSGAFASDVRSNGHPFTIMIALPLPKMPVKGRFAPWAIVQASVIGIAYAIESSMQIAWFAVRPGPPPVSGVLRVGLSTRSDLVLVLTTDLLNLIPGTMVLEIDRHRCLVYVHVLDVGSEKAVEKFYRQTRTLERLLITAFERPVPKHPLRAKK